MEVTFSPRARAIVVWIGFIAGALLLLEAAHALKPFAWAIITAYIFHPLVSFIHRKTRLPKHLITAWLYVMLGLVITILLINFLPPLVDQLKQLQDEIPNAVDDAQTWINRHQLSRLQRLGVEADYVDTRLNEIGKQAADLIGNAALPLALRTVSVAIDFVIYLVASFYFIVYGDRFVQSIRGVFNRRYHNEFDRLMLDINSTLGAYIRGQALLVVIMSVASYVGLTVFGVSYALAVAIATGFLELIPIVGPWTAGAIAVSVALFQDTTPFGWSHATLAIVVGLLYFTLRQLEDAFVIPLVIGRIIHLHPLLVIFVIVVGTALGGILGLVLAVPIAAVIKIITTYFYGKVMARETRHVEVIAQRDDLERLGHQFQEMTNATIVVLIEPNVLDWDDLPLVRNLAELALDHAVALSAVTPDGIAGSLFTAAGVSTATIPTSLPVAMEPIGR
ncbi:MAG TPA: AI-2E family transporter [Thermomicrobiales bacterium]|jgi:predicted PurR-regulated permease PerM